MDRIFVRSTLDVDHKTSAYKIVCRQCAKSDKIACASHSGSLPPEVTAKKFKQRGWSVGRHAGDDMCATCVADNLKARKAPVAIVEQPTPAPAGVVLPDLTQAPPIEKMLNISEVYAAGWGGKDKIYDLIKFNVLPHTKPLAGPILVKESDLERLLGEPKGIRRYAPKKIAPPLVNDGVIKMNDQSATAFAMSKEDRRIIFSEIDSHYLDEKRGYETAWNDERVAAGLKVMIEWVRSIREDNFGPEKGDTIDAEIEKLRAASAEAQKIIDTMRAVWKEMDATLATYEEKQTELSAEANKINTAIIEAKAAIDAAINRK